MQRKQFMPRPHWQRQDEEAGFHLHCISSVYWDESIAYQFNAAQVEHFEALVDGLHQLCMETVAWIIANDHFAPFHLPDFIIDEIRASWQRRDRAICGRFDFSWDGVEEPKLLEYNADAPDGLLETGIMQSAWQQDVLPCVSQFNSLHEKLINAWRDYTGGAAPPAHLHFCAIDGNTEDTCNTLYMMDVASHVGLPVSFLPVESIRYHSGRNCLIDNAGLEIIHCYKLHPWEWLWQSTFAPNIAVSGARFIEPAWTFLLSSKAILPLLWQRYPDHPNLLPASYDTNICGPCVRKPLYSHDRKIWVFLVSNVIYMILQITECYSGLTQRKILHSKNYHKKTIRSTALIGMSLYKKVLHIKARYKKSEKIRRHRGQAHRHTFTSLLHRFHVLTIALL